MHVAVEKERNLAAGVDEKIDRALATQRAGLVCIFWQNLAVDRHHIGHDQRRAGRAGVELVADLAFRPNTDGRQGALG